MLHLQSKGSGRNARLLAEHDPRSSRLRKPLKTKPPLQQAFDESYQMPAAKG